MSSHPGAESLRDIISLLISVDVTGDKNIVSVTPLSMKDKGDLSILTILLAKVGPMFTKKSLNFADQPFIVSYSTIR